MKHTMREAFDQAFEECWKRIYPISAGRTLDILFLIRHDDWRSLIASWWTGKEVCVIGADVSGNFLLRHCDGSVRYWDHQGQVDETIAASVIEFCRKLR